MDNKELLQKLEETHHLTAQAILELRELVKREADFTPEAKERVQNKVKELIGTEQKKANELDDYREFAKVEEVIKV